MKKIAFFDFDGTITTKNTLLQVIKFQNGRAGLYSGFLTKIPYLIAFKFKLISNQEAKEQILKHFFKGMTLDSFQQTCDAFADKALPSLIRRQAIAEVKKLQALDFEIVIVSASAENWIKKWAGDLGIRVLGSKLQTDDNLLTGNISGRNCNGDEKVNRIKSVYDLSQYKEIYCYGDTKGDKAMLALATKAFFKPFR